MRLTSSIPEITEILASADELELDSVTGYFPSILYCQIHTYATARIFCTKNYFALSSIFISYPAIQISQSQSNKIMEHVTLGSTDD